MWKLTKWLRIITAEDSFFSYILKSFRRRREPFFFFWSIIFFFFFSGGRAEKEGSSPFVGMCGHIKVQYACKHIRYCVLFWCKLLSSLALADFEAKHFSGIENLTSVYMCIGYVCGWVWDREDERLTWNGGAEYMDTQQRCPLQICRRETRLLDVCGEFKRFTYLTYWKC